MESVNQALRKRKIKCANRRHRVMHCHDMKGGYNNVADGEYFEAFSSWDCIDEFCYFSHNRITIPPAKWINRAHEKGVLCLGTIITEHAKGVAENGLLLDNAAKAAAQLARVCKHYAFDGYLVNIEAPLPGGASDVPRLAKFVSMLRDECRAVRKEARVIVYDSVARDGTIRWANELTPPNSETSANYALFSVADGIFLNYWWTEKHLERTRMTAAERSADVYVGVDCFGRGPNTPGPGPACSAAVQKCIADYALSVAIFAPGWVMESGPANGVSAEEAAEHDRKFWLHLFASQ